MKNGYSVMLPTLVRLVGWGEHCEPQQICDFRYR